MRRHMFVVTGDYALTKDFCKYYFKLSTLLIPPHSAQWTYMNRFFPAQASQERVTAWLKDFYNYY